jgi:hypothetical protein
MVSGNLLLENLGVVRQLNNLVLGLSAGATGQTVSISLISESLYHIGGTSCNGSYSKCVRDVQLQATSPANCVLVVTAGVPNIVSQDNVSGLTVVAGYKMVSFDATSCVPNS